MEPNASIPPQDSGFGEIESLVMAAGGYVQPSADLRPRTIELAKDRQSVVSSRRRLVGAALAASLLVSLCVQWTRLSNSGANPFDTRTSQKLHQSALRRSAETGDTLDWALWQAYDEQRRWQAETVGAAFR